jgi:hypothetical protein
VDTKEPEEIDAAVYRGKKSPMLAEVDNQNPESLDTRWGQYALIHTVVNKFKEGIEI